MMDGGAPTKKEAVAGGDVEISVPFGGRAMFSGRLGLIGLGILVGVGLLFSYSFLPPVRSTLQEVAGLAATVLMVLGVLSLVIAAMAIRHWDWLRRQIGPPGKNH